MGRRTGGGKEGERKGGRVRRRTHRWKKGEWSNWDGVWRTSSWR